MKLLFVGESHTDIEFHDVQRRVIEELHKRGRQVLVGLEMYPVPEQPWLDRWHSDKALGEEGFLTESHWYKNWGYHWNYYRDIFLFARANGIRMFGVNLPRAAVQTIRMKGFDALPPTSGPSCRRRWTSRARSTGGSSRPSSAPRTPSTAACPSPCSRRCTGRSADGTRGWPGTRCGP